MLKACQRTLHCFTRHPSVLLLQPPPRIHFHRTPILSRSFTMSAPAPAEANLHKDEVTGEMVSKS